MQEENAVVQEVAALWYGVFTMLEPFKRRVFLPALPIFFSAFPSLIVKIIISFIKIKVNYKLNISAVCIPKNEICYSDF